LAPPRSRWWYAPESVRAVPEERNEIWVLLQPCGGVGGALLGSHVDAVEEGDEGAGHAEVFSETGLRRRMGKRGATQILYPESSSADLHRSSRLSRTQVIPVPCID
jgi:hypothetical protein